MGPLGRTVTACACALIASCSNTRAQTVNNGVGSYAAPGNAFTVNWVADEATQTIKATFTAQTTGWVSLGLSNNPGGHNTVDTVVAWVSDVDGTLTVIDGSMNNGNGLTQPIADNQQDWTPDAATPPAQDATTTTFALTRSFNTNNAGQDASFENGNQYLHWAIGVADGTGEGAAATYAAHPATPNARGAVPVNFRQGAAGGAAGGNAGDKVFLGLDMTELIIIGGGGGAAVLMIGGAFLVYGGSSKKGPSGLPMSSPPPMAPTLTPSPSPPPPMGGMAAPMGGMAAPMGGGMAAPMGGMGGMAAPMGGGMASPMGGMGGMAAPMGGGMASPMGGMAAPMGGMAPTPAPRPDAAGGGGGGVGIWKTAKDNNGVTYYYNKGTGQSQYNAPPGMGL